MAPSRPLRVLFWGTYDKSKPRTRILIQGLQENGVTVEECHASVWETVRDKAVSSRWLLAARWLRAGVAYPRLMLEFLRAPAPDVLIAGYMGQLDVLLIRPLARLRGVPVVWDQFISLYDTVVNDRRQLRKGHPLAMLLYMGEWLACRAADRVLMDTQAHAAHITELFGLRAHAVQSVWVGAETAKFPPAVSAGHRGGSSRVLFYGQLIPLHGVEIILDAARRLKSDALQFVFIGSGQEEQRVRELLSREPLPNIEWIPWVEYEQLSDQIRAADICLGIFGTTGKASRVIPNKVFQIIAAGRTLITRDSPAIRELLVPGTRGIHLIPAGDGGALAESLRALASDPERAARVDNSRLREAISPRGIGRQLIDVLEEVLARRPPSEI